MKLWPMLLAFVLTPAMADLRLGGTAQWRSAVETRDGELQLAELSILPSLEWRHGFDLTAIARLRADTQDKLEPGIPAQAAIAPGSRRAVSTHAETELRELYLDLDWGDNYLRLGKQQIVWGRADGLKILDQVNPQSYREFILAEFSESRIPLWSLKWERPLGDQFDLQVIYLPDQSYHDIPDADAAFAITSPELLPVGGSQPVVGRTLRRPDRRFADADAGLQLSTRLAGWDLTLNYLYHYADTPVVQLRTVAGGVIAEIDYERSHLLGGSATNAFGDFTVRAEFGYSTDRYFPAAEPTPGRASLAANEWAYVLGLDWTGLSDTLISAQLFQSRASLRGASRGAVETDVTLLAQRHWLNQTLTLRALAIHDLDRGDGLLSPSVSYALRANLTLALEGDIFYGSSRGRYGQFDQRDRVVLAATYAY